MIRRLGLIGLGLCVAALASAQDKSAFPFVDIGRAQALIDVMLRENETLKNEAQSLRTQAAALSAQSAGAQKAAADLTPLYDEVRARFGELVSIDADLVDRGLKDKAGVASTKYLELVKRLRARLDELGATTTKTNEDVQRKLAQAATDEARVVRNTDDIIVLQAALARTKAQQDRLESVLRRLEQLGVQAETSMAAKP